jgi:hypothetical protein
MPDFAPNYTPRVVTKYLSAGLEHDALIRGPRGAVLADVVNGARATMTGLMTALHTLLPSDFAFISMKSCPKDDIIFSAETPPTNGTAGVIDPATMSHMNRACELNFNGRASSTPWSMAIFGVFFSLDDPASPASNGRIEPGESAAVTAALAVFAANVGLAANNNLRPIINTYVNYKVNDHWLAIARKSAI